MKQKIEWSKTLNNIVYRHNENTILFTIKDVEDLSSYVIELKDAIKTLKHRETVLIATNKELSKKVVAALLTPVHENASTFKMYA